MINPAKWPCLLKLIPPTLAIIAWIAGCMAEPTPPNLNEVEPLAGAGETQASCASRGMILEQGQCKWSADLTRGNTCTPACGALERCVENRCVSTDTRTAKQKCEAENPGRTCNEQGEVALTTALADTPAATDSDSTGSGGTTSATTTTADTPAPTCEPGQTPTPECSPTAAGAETQTTQTTPTEPQHVVQEVPTDDKGVFMQLPASITTLSATDFSELAGSLQSTEAAGCKTKPASPEPASGAAAYKSKGGDQSQPPQAQLTTATPATTPEQPTVSDLESPQACPDSSKATSSSAPPHLCLDPAYRQATLAAGDGPAETFQLVNFGTTAYLSFAAEGTTGAITVKKGPYTIIEHTLLKIQPQYLIHGLTTDGKQAVMHHQPPATLDTYTLASGQTQSILQANLNLTPGASPAALAQAAPITIGLGSYQHAAITLFAFGPWTSIDQATLVRHVSKDNTLKVDLAAQGHCVGIYANATKTKFPVVLLTSVAEPPEPTTTTP